MTIFDAQSAAVTPPVRLVGRTALVPQEVFDSLAIRVTQPHAEPVGLIRVADTILMPMPVYADLLARADAWDMPGLHPVPFEDSLPAAA